jgi:WD40 repeat protein
MTTYQRAYTIPTDGDVITDFQFSPDSSRLAINSQSNTGIIWDIPTQQTVMTISGHPGSVLSVTFSPDSRWIASAGGNTVKLWDAVTGEELLTLYGHTAALNILRFSPDSYYLTTSAADFTVRTWIISRDELLAVAESRVSRTWTQEECQRYLHTDVCPTDI